MKKLVSLGLLLTLLIQQGGYWVQFELNRYSIRKSIKNQIKQSIPDQQLIAWNIDAISMSKEFEWEEENKEFRYQENLYDIVHYSNGKWLCINDKQESQLFANLDNIIKQYFGHNQKGINALKRFLGLFQLESIVDVVSFNWQLLHPIMKSIQWIGFNFAYDSIDMDIKTPPPNFFLD